MLGKAADIDIETVYSELEVKEWLVSNTEKLVIDIRLSVVTPNSWHQQGEVYLIIYKEA